MFVWQLCGGTEIKGFHGNFCYTTGLHSNPQGCYIYTYINVKLTSLTSHNPDAFLKLGLNLLIIRSWTKEVLRAPAEVKGWTQKVHHCDHRWNGSEQNKPTSDCPEHKVDTKSLAGSDTSHWGSCTYGSSKGEVSIWVLWSPAMAPWLQLDNIHSVEHHTTATQENSPK